jgi:hypothetical protein
MFSPKKSAKMAFLNQNNSKFCKNLIVTLVFEKNANFFAENDRKSLKIVIVTSTPVFSQKIAAKRNHKMVAIFLVERNKILTIFLVERKKMVAIFLVERKKILTIFLVERKAEEWFSCMVSDARCSPLTDRVARFYFVKHTKTEENIPNDQKMYQIAIKYNKWP